MLNASKPIEMKLIAFFDDALNNRVKAYGRTPKEKPYNWIEMGYSLNDAKEYLKKEKYIFIISIDVPEENKYEIYEKDGNYYMMGLEQNPDSDVDSWGSFIVDLTPVKSYIDKLLNDETILKQRAEEVCYGREDLLQVAEVMANEYGNPSVGEELCGVMAEAAEKFLSKIRLNPSWDAEDDF